MMPHQRLRFRENVNRKRSGGNIKPQSKRILRLKTSPLPEMLVKPEGSQGHQGKPLFSGFMLSSYKVSIIVLPGCGFFFFWKHGIFQLKKSSWGNVQTASGIHSIPEGLALKTHLLLGTTDIPYCLPQNIFVLIYKIFWLIKYSWGRVSASRVLA